MAPANPWLALLGEDDQKSSQPNASYDPDIQALMNAQAATPEASQAAPTPAGPFDWLNQMAPGETKAPSQGMDFNQLSKLFPAFDAKKSPGYSLQQEAVDKLKAYRDKLDSAPNKLDLSPLMALADAWNKGSNLVGSYKAPMSAEDRAAKQAAVNEAIAKEGASMSEQDLKALNDQKTLAALGLKFNGANSEKESQQDQSAAQKFEAKLAADTASSRSALGGASNRVYAADRINQLISQSKDPNKLSPQQVKEIAISLNSMLAPGNPNVTMYEDLVPKSAQGSAASIEQYIGGIPEGAGQGEFVKNLANTIQREKAVSQQQIQDYYKTRAGSNAEMAWVKRNPSLFKSIVSSHLKSLTAGGGEPMSSAPASDFKVGEIRINKNDGLPYRKEADGSYTKVVGGQ